MEYKFDEGDFLKKIEKYIDSTYVAHYTNQNGMQLLEFFDDEKIKDFCQISASKYILRFGRKNGKDIKDLYKSIHYMMILMYKLEQEEFRCSLVGCENKKQHIHEIQGPTENTCKVSEISSVSCVFGTRGCELNHGGGSGSSENFRYDNCGYKHPGGVVSGVCN
jgi:hypothetical protein